VNSDKPGPSAATRRRKTARRKTGRRKTAVRDAAGRAVVFAGPTASGKSQAALGAAKEFGGVVVNADSMQVYRELAILSARPDAAALAAAPHKLYGTIPAREACSAARWRALALAAIDAAGAAGKLPILAGGTGLYLEALAKGLAPVPDIPAPVRAEARNLMAGEGAKAFHARLARLDPAAAAALRPSDRQRLLRAWEVMTATGKPLGEWQRGSPAPGDAPALLTFLFLPPRDALYAACDRRFAAMIAAGAVEEVKALLALDLDPELPAMKAVGVREIAAYLRGEIDRARMMALGQQATRRYAKRQYTWFRHRLPGAVTLHEQYSERLDMVIFKKIRETLLTL
jgi:tRNA dimethylallyltransferase